MAKIYGLFGSMTGKVADVVMSSRYGEQIVRKYQPNVLNPQTALQVQSRAKLKLLSQMSAVMAPAIAISKSGAVTSRNRFLKINYGLATYADNTAQIALANVKLTDGIIAMPAFSVTRNALAIELALLAPLNGFDRVVYSVFVKQIDDTLRFIGSTEVETPGTASAYPTNMSVGVEAPLVVYAYGVRFNNDSSRTKYGDMIAVQSESLAKLISTRALLETDVTLTETRGVEVPTAA